MSILLGVSTRTLRSNLTALNFVYPTCSRRLYSKNTIIENDIVLLKNINNSTSTPILSNRLRAGKKIELLFKDSISHDDILGKGLRDLVSSRKRATYRIQEQTLAEHTDLSARIVTPIYSQDANLIVSLLDLHPTVPDSNHPTRSRLEIFEAGTGHGALTLNLARAIHGANTAAPELPAEDASAKMSPDILETKREAYKEWRANRGAVIHTLDCSAKHSAYAETVVQNFRRGMYYPHIDFHVGSIDDYLSSRLAETGGSPFLDHAILDLPGTQRYLDIVARSLKSSGTLVTFCPSVIQINTGVMYARQEALPLFLEKTVEVGGAVGVGGREWDIRPVKPRALLKTLVPDANRTDDVEAVKGLMEGASGEFGSHQAGSSPVKNASSSNDNGWEMVCRPKVGLKISGGGFVGVWRKMA